MTLVLVAVCGTAAAANARRPADFAEAAVKTMGARSVRCSPEVRSAVRTHQMVAVCARFDGDFDAFHARWTERLDLDVATFPDTTPRTAWEHRDGTYERIYAVGGTAMGVRFTAGDLLLVFPE